MHGVLCRDDRLRRRHVDDFLLPEKIHVTSLACLTFEHELVPVLLAQVILVAVNPVQALLFLLLLSDSALVLSLLSS